MLDLWGDEQTPTTTKLTPELATAIQDKDIEVSLTDKIITLRSRIALESAPDFSSLLNVERVSDRGVHIYTIPLRPLNSFILRYLLRSYTLAITPNDAKTLTNEADRIPLPTAQLATTGKHIEVKFPSVEVYRSVVRTLNGYPLQNGAYRIPVTRTLDFKTLASRMETALPPFAISSNVNTLTTAPIEGFDGTMESLKTIPISVLNMVKANNQTYKAVKKSQKSLDEKLEIFGIKTLHDLVMWLPKRYIDKSAPQEIRDLMIDEPATIIGTVELVEDLPRNMGVRFVIATASGNSIPVSFWRQHWLKAKFHIGSEVLVTGKLTFWNKQRHLNGTSIEDAKEASVLPIVPIYKQSESKGITTAFLLSAVRELFSRLGPITLPPYLIGENRLDYYEAFKELHLPEDLAHHKKVLDSLAYYELVLMQLLIQEAKEQSLSRSGLVIDKSSRNLQEKAIATLPFTLTTSQVKAVEALNEKLGNKTPSSTLLNADVGAGKSIVAQLACLRAVEAGYQAVILGPTDTLARQLYSTFEKIITALAAKGETVTMVYLAGGMKAAERRKILAAIKSGKVDIVVGTHSVMSDSVEYANLGFIAIDEQQKFGVEQRTKLLTSRFDGNIPDLLMQTATPIPRSTAQVFYGDVDMLLLTEKPPGRLPIITKWVKEDPNEVITQAINPMWSDIQEEASKGNQTFIITPMVKDSSTIDAASVERTYATLEKTFSTLRVGFIHGQMKQEQQVITMEAFRRKEFDVLVASTVVEVGVDIPDATRVVVLSADRMGASSLHQIRGRVGRNNKQSYCYLVSLGLTENSQIRLQSLVDSSEGIEVAKADLLVRGEGKLFSDSQSGASEMMFASLIRHGKWVKQAKEEALAILASPHRALALDDSRKHFQAEGRLV